MMDKKDPWGDLIDGARRTVADARGGDLEAAYQVISNAAQALHGLMVFDESDPSRLRQNVTDADDPRRLVFQLEPSPEQLVYLQSLLISLKAILNGVPPDTALHVKRQAHRPPNSTIGLRDALIFFEVGKEYDRIVGEAAVGVPDPVRQAIRIVAERSGHSIPSVEKMWQKYGRLEGWKRERDDKENPDRK